MTGKQKAIGINRQERHLRFFAFFLISAGKGSSLVTLLTFSWRYRQSNSLDLTNLELTNSTQSFINSLSLFLAGSWVTFGWLGKTFGRQLGHFWRAGQKARILIHCDNITGNVFTLFDGIWPNDIWAALSLFCK